MPKQVLYRSIESIPPTDTFKILLFSLFWGLWVLLKRLTFKVWNPKSLEYRNKRETPPSCLVISSYGNHSFIKLKGVKLHYVEAGDKTNPVLLFLHGFPDCWIGWRHQIQEFAKSHRVIAVDLKGFGDSDKPLSRKNYRLNVLLTELQDLITSLGVQSCCIVGHDLGALLGWYLAHLAPELVTKFVAISCPHPNIYWSALPNSSLFNSRWIHFSQIPHLPEIDALKDDLSIINNCHQHLVNRTKCDSFLDAYKYTFSRIEDWTGPINYYRNLPFCRVGKSSTISVPCLLIVGNKDSCVQLESIMKSTEYVEKFHLKVIENCGHFPHQEYPEIVNHSLFKFIGGNAAVSPEKPEAGLVNRFYGSILSAKEYGNQLIGNFQQEIATKAVSLSQTPATILSVLKS